MVKSHCLNGVSEADPVNQIISSVEIWHTCLIYVQCVLCFASLNPDLCTIQKSGHFD